MWSNKALFLRIVCAFVFILFGGCAKKPTIDAIPLIYTVDTTLLKIGDLLTIKGAHFGTTSLGFSVSVGNTALPIVSFVDSEIQVQIEGGVRSGLLRIAKSNGQTATYVKPIRVIALGQPVILSIIPNKDVEVDDTLNVRGLGFSNFADSVGISVGGVKARVVSVNDSIVRVIVPVVQSSGDVILSVGRMVSFPYPVQLALPEPSLVLKDGRFYYIIRVTNATVGLSSRFISSFLVRGASDRGSRGGTPVQVPRNVILPDNFLAVSGTALYKDEVEDLYCPGGIASGVGTSISSTGTTYISKYNLAGPSVIYEFRLRSPVTDFNRNMLSSGKGYSLGGAASQIVKTENFLFQVPGGGGQADLRGSSGLSYQALNNPNSVFIKLAIPELVGNTSVHMSGGPEHNDSVLIYGFKGLPETSTGLLPPIRGFIYLWDMSQRKLTKLYDENNWIDSFGSGQTLPYGSGNRDLNLGLLWKGNYIYYANGRRDPNSTQLFRLNLDGTSKKPVLIYYRMEPVGASKATDPIGMTFRSVERL